MNGDLDRYRREIDEVDRSWIHTLARRFEITERVGRYKRENGLDAADPERERRQISAIRDEAARCGVDPDLVETIFRTITDRVKERHREIAGSD